MNDSHVLVVRREQCEGDALPRGPDRPTPVRDPGRSDGLAYRLLYELFPTERGAH